MCRVSWRRLLRGGGALGIALIGGGSPAWAEPLVPLADPLPPAPPAERLAALWVQGDGVALGTLIVLLAMSVASWSVIVVRTLGGIQQARQAGRVARFWAGGGLAALVPGSPQAALVEAAQEADALFRAGQVTGVDRHTWLGLALHRVIAETQSRVQEGQTLLATVGATAPFVGLFGTVWSIHRALTALGGTVPASLETVAGPVGEALIMTALGLLVAVPAVLAYNALIRSGKNTIDPLRLFAADIESALLSGRWPGAGRP